MQKKLGKVVLSSLFLGLILFSLNGCENLRNEKARRSKQKSANGAQQRRAVKCTCKQFSSPCTKGVKRCSAKRNDYDPSWDCKKKPSNQSKRTKNQVVVPCKRTRNQAAPSVRTRNKVGPCNQSYQYPSETRASSEKKSQRYGVCECCKYCCCTHFGYCCEGCPVCGPCSNSFRQCGTCAGGCCCTSSCGPCSNNTGINCSGCFRSPSRKSASPRRARTQTYCNPGKCSPNRCGYSCSKHCGETYCGGGYGPPPSGQCSFCCSDQPNPCCYCCRCSYVESGCGYSNTNKGNYNNSSSKRRRSRYQCNNNCRQPSVTKRKSNRGGYSSTGRRQSAEQYSCN